jgi:outer membrane protein
MSSNVWRSTTAVAGRIVLSLSALALLPSTAAVAQSGKMAVIDVQRLVTDSVAGKEALARLKKLQDDKIAEGKAKNDEVDALRKRLNEGRLSLADDKISELEKQLEEKVTGLRRFQEDAEREFNKSRETTFGEIERRVFPVIEQVGKEGGYTFVFNKFQSGLLYADDAADITNQIIQRFDASATQKAN